VRDNDIFPEEFPRFLAFPKRARDELMKRHGDLFRPKFWRDTQRRLRAGQLPHIFPYRSERQLRPSSPERRLGHLDGAR
jgi:isocitrate dehydrogenase kinase/phosphatase